MGLFFLTFVLSTIGLVSLTQDDKKDLSSHASGGVQDVQQVALGKDPFISNDSIWFSSDTNFPYQVKFDKNVWQSPAGNETVFVNRNNFVTVRFGTKAELSQENIGQILGKNFVLLKENSEVKTTLSGWKVAGYIYKLFGENKFVNICIL